MLSVIYAVYCKQAHYAECHYAECCYAECHGAIKEGQEEVDTFITLAIAATRKMT